MKKSIVSLIILVLCISLSAIDMEGGISYIDFSSDLKTGAYPCAIGAEAIYRDFEPFPNHPTKICFNFDAGLDSRLINVNPETGEPFTKDNKWEFRKYDVIFSNWYAEINQRLGDANQYKLTLGIRGTFEAAFNPIVKTGETTGNPLDNPVFETPNVGIPELSGDRQLNSVDVVLNLHTKLFDVKTMFSKEYLLTVISSEFKKDLKYDVYSFISASASYLNGKCIPYYAVEKSGGMENSRFSINSSAGFKYEGKTYWGCLVPEASLNLNYGLAAGELNNTLEKHNILYQKAGMKFSVKVSLFDSLSLSCGFEDVFLYTGSNPDIQTGFKFKKPSFDLIIRFVD